MNLLFSDVHASHLHRHAYRCVLLVIINRSHESGNSLRVCGNKKALVEVPDDIYDPPGNCLKRNQVKNENYYVFFRKRQITIFEPKNRFWEFKLGQSNFKVYTIWGRKNTARVPHCDNFKKKIASGSDKGSIERAENRAFDGALIRGTSYFHLKIRVVFGRS